MLKGFYGCANYYIDIAKEIDFWDFNNLFLGNLAKSIRLSPFIYVKIL